MGEPGDGSHPPQEGPATVVAGSWVAFPAPGHDLCPRCAAPLRWEPGPMAVCDACGLSLGGAAVDRLASVGRWLADWAAYRRVLVEREVAAAGSPLSASGFVDGSVGEPLAGTRGAREPWFPRLSVGELLAWLGSGCLVLAVAIFGLVAWSDLGSGARWLVLTALTGVSLAMVLAAVRVRMQGIAEGLAAVWLTVGLVDVGAGRALVDSGVAPHRWWAGGLVVLAALLTGLGRVTRLTSMRVMVPWLLLAAWAAVVLEDRGGGDYLFVSAVGAAGFAVIGLVLAWRPAAGLLAVVRPERNVGYAGSAGSVDGAGRLETVGETGGDSVWVVRSCQIAATTAWIVALLLDWWALDEAHRRTGEWRPLLVAGLFGLSALCGWVLGRELPNVRRWVEAVATVWGLIGVWVLAGALLPEGFRGAVTLFAAVAVARLAHSRTRVEGGSDSLGGPLPGAALVCAVVAFRPAVVLLGGAVSSATSWALGRSVSRAILRPDAAFIGPLELLMSVAALGAVTVGWPSSRRSRVWGAGLLAGLAGLGGASLARPAGTTAWGASALPLGWRLAVVGLTGVVGTAAAVVGWPPRTGTDDRRAVGTWLTLAAVLGGICLVPAAPGVAVGVFAVLVALAVLLAEIGPADYRSMWAALVVPGVAATVGAVARVAGSGRYGLAALVAVGAASGLAVVAERLGGRRLRLVTPLETGSVVGGLVAFVVAAGQGVDRPSGVVEGVGTGHLVVPLLVVATALAAHAFRPARRGVAIAAALAGLSALWAALGAEGVDLVEAYSLPAAILLALWGVGVWRRTRRSWPAWGAPLVVAALPTLVAVVAGDGGTRGALLLVAAAVTVVGGVTARLQALVGVGAAAIVALGVVQLPSLLEGVAPWQVFAVVGVALVLVGVLFETWRSLGLRVVAYYRDLS